MRSDITQLADVRRRRPTPSPTARSRRVIVWPPPNFAYLGPGPRVTWPPDDYASLYARPLRPLDDNTQIRLAYEIHAMRIAAEELVRGKRGPLPAMPSEPCSGNCVAPLWEGLAWKAGDVSGDGSPLPPLVCTRLAGHKDPVHEAQGSRRQTVAHHLDEHGGDT